MEKDPQQETLITKFHNQNKNDDGKKGKEREMERGKEEG